MHRAEGAESNKEATIARNHTLDTLPQELLRLIFSIFSDIQSSISLQTMWKMGCWTQKNHWMVNDLSNVETGWSFNAPKRNSCEWEISFPFLILYATVGKVEFYNIQTGKCVITSEDFPIGKYNTFQNGQLFGMSSDRKTIIKLDFNYASSHSRT